MRIALVASEGVPYSKTGGLADVVGALPKALVAAGHDVEVILPVTDTNRQGSALLQEALLSLSAMGSIRIDSGRWRVGGG